MGGRGGALNSRRRVSILTCDHRTFSQDRVRASASWEGTCSGDREQ